MEGSLGRLTLDTIDNFLQSLINDQLMNGQFWKWVRSHHQTGTTEVCNFLKSYYCSSFTLQWIEEKAEGRTKGQGKSWKIGWKTKGILLVINNCMPKVEIISESMYFKPDFSGLTIIFIAIALCWSSTIALSLLLPEHIFENVSHSLDFTC